MIGYINIEGLTRVKQIQMEELIISDKVDYLILAETHCRGRKFEWQTGIRTFEVQRSIMDKGRGGLLFAMKEREGRKVVKKERKSKDIIEVEINEGKHK